MTTKPYRPTVEQGRLINALLRNRAERGGAGKMVIHFDGAGRIRKIEEAASFNFDEGREK